MSPRFTTTLHDPANGIRLVPYRFHIIAHEFTSMEVTIRALQILLPSGSALIYCDEPQMRELCEWLDAVEDEAPLCHAGTFIICGSEAESSGLHNGVRLGHRYLVWVTCDPPDPIPQDIPPSSVLQSGTCMDIILPLLAFHALPLNILLTCDRQIPRWAASIANYFTSSKCDVVAFSGDAAMVGELKERYGDRDREEI